MKVSNTNKTYKLTAMHVKMNLNLKVLALVINDTITKETGIGILCTVHFSIAGDPNPKKWIGVRIGIPAVAQRCKALYALFSM